ncbi:TetR/AcrR family transcriptional regulator C-terminal domain-containing protein [Clostridium sp.]|uniref:TetR/AcrR family transcriptional regulator C-terminal domain-containing protein n=1 Tax=Clostridium sp. TaxID=1506 RepID=UPI0035A0DB6E
MRVDVTKNIIKDSFFKLLSSNKDIDKITISSIITKAKISRQTFYYHFQDIYDLQEWVIKTGFEEIKNMKAETYRESLDFSFDYVSQHKKLINKSLQSLKREFIEKIIFENFKNYLYTLLRIEQFGDKISQEDYNFSIEFISYAITGICIKLVSDKGLQISTGDLIDKIDKLVVGKMIDIK